MNITRMIQNVEFDDTATWAMGEAFDRACVSLSRFGTLITARELIAKRIIAAAKNGEHDPARLCEQALIPFGIEDMSMLVVSVGRDSQSAAYAFGRARSVIIESPALCTGPPAHRGGVLSRPSRFIHVGQFAFSTPELRTTAVPKVWRDDDAFPA